MQTFPIKKEGADQKIQAARKSLIFKELFQAQKKGSEPGDCSSLTQSISIEIARDTGPSHQKSFAFKDLHAGIVGNRKIGFTPGSF